MDFNIIWSTLMNFKNAFASSMVHPLQIREILDDVLKKFCKLISLICDVYFCAIKCWPENISTISTLNIIGLMFIESLKLQWTSNACHALPKSINFIITLPSELFDTFSVSHITRIRRLLHYIYHHAAASIHNLLILPTSTRQHSTIGVCVFVWYEN